MRRILRRFIALVWFGAEWIVHSARDRQPPWGDGETEAADPAEPAERRWRPAVLRFLARQAAVFAVLAVVGLAVVISGVAPIKASSGHWAITAWFLHFSMQRSIATHSLGIEAPPLADRRLVLLGAGHFHTGCRPCHGSPGLPHPPIAQAMTPHPPDLAQKVPQWRPEELFYLVKHGVKFTGMPAWPARQRDDEVWAVTAFLLELPELDAEQYRELVHGEASRRSETPLAGLTGSPSSAPQVIQTCARCHGVAGEGRGRGAFPILAGQSAEYLQDALQAYAQGVRHSGMMAPLAVGLSPDEIRRAARYYAACRPPKPEPWEDSSEAVQRGEAIARDGIPDRKLPACADCHGPAEDAKNPHYPRLAGQYADYLLLQLRLFQEERRGGSQYAHLMHPVASRLSREDMRDVAAYYASLAP